MTAKHFNAIALVLNHQLKNASYTDNIMTPAMTGEKLPEQASSEVFRVEAIARDLANEFGKFNPNFNPSKFLSVALG
jgi:hypothetical protein